MSSLPSANWSYPTSVRFGAGRIKELPKAVMAAGMRNPLLVTDPGLAGLPMVAEAIAGLEAAGLNYFVLGCTNLMFRLAYTPYFSAAGLLKYSATRRDTI